MVMFITMKLVVFYFCKLFSQSTDVVWIKDPVDVTIPAEVQKDGSVKILWGRRKGEKDLQVKGSLEKLLHCTKISLEPKDNLVSAFAPLVPGPCTYFVLHAGQRV